MDKIGISLAARLGLILCLLSLPVPRALRAETFYLTGTLSSEFQVRITKTFTVPSGVLTLSVPGAAPARDFIEAGVGIDMPIRDNIRASAHLGAFIPFTGSASLQARAGLNMAF